VRRPAVDSQKKIRIAKNTHELRQRGSPYQIAILRIVAKNSGNSTTILEKGPIPLSMRHIGYADNYYSVDPIDLSCIKFPMILSSLGYYDTVHGIGPSWFFSLIMIIFGGMAQEAFS